MYLGGGWAVKGNEGLVRRRVVGEGLGEGTIFSFFWRKMGEKG